MADGGNNRICLLDKEGKYINTIGRYLFKEPVGIVVSPDREVYVTDCHNHRVVIYRKDLKYIGEFGHYGGLKQAAYLSGRLRNTYNFL